MGSRVGWRNATAWRPPVLPVDELRDELHRPRPVEGDHGDDVLDARGLETLEGIAHARRLQLEHAEGPRLGEDLVGPRIVEGQRLGIEGDPLRLLDETGRVGDDGEGTEAEEVHLEEAQLLDGAHGEARDELGTLRIFVEGHALHEGLVGDDHGRGMDGRVPGASLEGARHRP